MAGHDTAAREPEWFRLMVESMTCFAVFSVDTLGHVVTWNAGAEQMFGYGAGEILGRPARVLFTDEDRSRRVAEIEMEEAVRTGWASDDRWHVRRDGSRFWASGMLMLMQNEYGTRTGFVKVVRDRTSEKLASDSLRVSEERFARTVLGSPAAFSIQSADAWRLTLVNEAFLKLTGFWRAEALGRSWSELGLWALPEEEAAVAAQLESTGRAGPLEVHLRAKHGSVLTVTTAFHTLDVRGELSVQAAIMSCAGVQG